jgi:hypothetical protein
VPWKTVMMFLKVFLIYYRLINPLKGILNPALKTFLQSNFPDAKVGKPSSKYILGLGEEKLGSAIQEGLGISCSVSKTTISIF